jgi:hypothetical protein
LVTPGREANCALLASVNGKTLNWKKLNETEGI